MSDEGRLEILRRLHADRWAAHRYLFSSRHPEASPAAHREIVGDIYAPEAHRSIEGFRGIGKSTYLEEAAVIRAGFHEFRNMVIVGASYSRACDRLAAIKREIEMNELVAKVFGEMRGHDTWQEGRIVLKSGACIQALGRNQSMTGIKHLDWRPDAALVDDLEDPDEVRSDPERQATWDWFLKTFLPSLDDPLRTWVRVLGTRRGKGSLPERLEAQGWKTTKYPLYYLNETGQRTATWPAKFPLEKVLALEELYRGDMATFAQEYMCEATSEQARTFRPEHIRVEPRVRTWETVWAMYDPARTVGARSATTGKAVWSWTRNRLIIWEGTANLWLPDQLIADVFETHEKYGPVWIGVEEDGLNEWIRQPLRHESVRRAVALPLRAVRAPRGKLDFIRGLQPYFEAGEVEFASPQLELAAQLLSFPYGKIDAPNALAYAMSLRPGAAIYDGFSEREHVAETVSRDPGRPLWLAANATRGVVTAVLLQYGMGRLSILADYVIESDPGDAVPLLLREVGMEFRATPTVSCGGVHYDRYMNVGLVQAFSRVPLAVERGQDPARGREVLRDDFSKLVRGGPAVRIATRAKFTLNALAGGYCRPAPQPDRMGMEEAEPGLYRTLMEGLESCLGRMAVAGEVDESANWAYTQDGRRYMKYGHATSRRV